MTHAPTLERVQALVAQIAGPDRIPSGAGPDTPLKDGGFWLDSASLLEVIIACEAEFDVVLEPETDFTDQALATTRALFTLIRAKRAS
jgi:acyl carrier protein